MSPESHAAETLFPELARSRDKVAARVLDAAHRVKLPGGSAVFHVGSACEKYLLVLAGSVRVQVLTDSGHAVVLYHVRAGESCILTTSCLLGGVPYPADGVTENSVVALAIDSVEFRRALDESAGFRKFVFRNIGQRFAKVIAHLTEIAFGSIDRRLAQALLQRLQASRSVRLTHQELATELSTAREVVSRHLKRFEQSGWVKLGRGRIEVLGLAALRRLAETSNGQT